MNIEITDELAIELADAHVEAFSGSPQRLTDVVGKLLVFIPDPRAPKPVESDFLDDHIKVIPVTVPAPAVVYHRRPLGTLTRHQREVYNDIVRMSRRRDRYVWVEAKYVGSKSACDRLQEKGWIEIEIRYGPRGGPLRSYRPTTMEGS